MAYPLAPHRDKKIRQGRATDRQTGAAGRGEGPILSISFTLLHLLKE